MVLGTDGSVLVVHETSFLKKGGSSAGVHRQHTGTAACIDNTQAACSSPWPPTRHRP
ncbi:hypothetical protein AB4212_31465 [Streptomyces sp. 2MCAF27]